MALYTHFKEKVKLEIFKCKTAWGEKLQHHKKGIWNVVNKLKGSDGSHHSGTFDYLLKLHGNARDLSNVINEYFTSNCVNDPITNDTACTIRELPLIEVFNPVSELEVFNLLSKLQVAKSPGLDGINGKLLKLGRDIISAPLAHIINVSVQSSTFPATWKVSVVVPITKKTKPNLTDLRPISLLPLAGF